MFEVNVKTVMDEYLRRNLLHCKSVGALANTRVALERARAVRRMPKWLVAALESIEVRIDPVTHEMAVHRDEVEGAYLRGEIKCLR